MFNPFCFHRKSCLDDYPKFMCFVSAFASAPNQFLNSLASTVLFLTKRLCSEPEAEPALRRNLDPDMSSNSVLSYVLSNLFVLRWRCLSLQICQMSSSAIGKNIATTVQGLKQKLSHSDKSGNILSVLQPASNHLICTKPKYAGIHSGYVYK